MFVVFGELGVNCKVGSLGYQRYDGKEKEKQIHIVTFVTLLGKIKKCQFWDILHVTKVNM